MDWETPGRDEKLKASNSDLLPELGGSDKHILWAGIERLSYGILPFSRSRSKILSGLSSASVRENEIIGRSATYTMSLGLNSV